MDKKLNVSQLADLFCASRGLSKNLANTFVRSFFDTITEQVSAGETVRIKGFGTFKQISINDRESVDVNTGERIIIPGHSKASFIPDAVLKDLINKPFAGFETVVVDSPEAVPVTSESDLAALIEKPGQEDNYDSVPEPQPELPESQPESIEPQPALTEPQPVVLTEPQPELVSAEQDSSSENVQKDNDFPVDDTPEKSALSYCFGHGRWLFYVGALCLLFVICGIWPLNLFEHKKNTGESAGKQMVEQQEANYPKTVVSDPDMEQRQIEDARKLEEQKKVEEAKKKEEERLAEARKQAELRKAEEIKKMENAKLADEARISNELNMTENQNPTKNPQNVGKAKTESTSESVNLQKPLDENTKSVAFVLTASDDAKPLADFTVADTTSYRITGTKAVHILADGDRLTKLSEQYYGTKKLWPYIAAYNHLNNSNSLEKGDKLNIPQLSAK